MERVLDVKASFTGCNIKAGKVTMSFELDPECRHMLGSLATITGEQVFLVIKSPQQVIVVDNETGEIIDDLMNEAAEMIDGQQALPEATYETPDLPEDIVIDDDEPAWFTEGGNAA